MSRSNSIQKQTKNAITNRLNRYIKAIITKSYSYSITWELKFEKINKNNGTNHWKKSSLTYLWKIKGF